MDWTHNVQLWLTNDYGFYQFVQERIADIVGDCWHPCNNTEENVSEALSILASEFDTYFGELLDEQAADMSPIFREWLDAAFHSVNWDRVVEYWTEEVAEAAYNMAERN
jgi:hypothetical protein